MGIRILEQKPEKSWFKGERRFLFYVTGNYQILHWQDLWIGEKQLNEYLKENPFPIDPYYSEKDFLNDITSEGFICAGVKNVETAEYMVDLFYELV